MNLLAYQKWGIFLGASLMIFLVNMDATVVNLALASIAKGLHIGLISVQWVISAYLLTTFMCFIVGGKLADMLGPKTVFLIGTAAFTIASLIAGLADNFTVLIVARLLQGLGFAFTLSLAILLITSVFPEQQRGYALGLSVAVSGLGQSLGPTIGGVILNVTTWHWIFLINIPFGILAFLVISILAKTPYDLKVRQHLDYWGIILMGGAFSVFLLTLSQVSRLSDTAMIVLVGGVLTLGLLLLLWWREKHVTNPLIDFALFGTRNFRLSLMIRFIAMSIWGSVLLLLPLYLQNIAGFSPLHAGLILLIYCVCFGLVSPFAGRMCDRYGFKPMIVLALVLIILAFIGFACFTTETLSLPLLAIVLMLFGASVGIITPTTVVPVMAVVPKSSIGEGMGMFYTTAFAGLSVGVAVVSVLVHFLSLHYLVQHAPAWPPAMSMHGRELIQHAATGVQSVTALHGLVSADAYGVWSHLVKSAYLHAMHSVMLLAAGLAATALWLATRYD